MKLLVIGNCQARPLSDILTACSALTPLPPIILHLANESDADEDRARMDEADIVLTQLTAPSFDPVHLRTEVIKDTYPDKTRVWPNIFYAGQQPWLRYVTHPDRGRVVSALDVYHDLRLLEAWYLDRTGQNPLPPMPDLEAIHQRSLAALADRELSCDVRVCDLIDTHRHDRRLFFTFNHPTRWLLEAVAMRLAEVIGFEFAPVENDRRREPLGRIMPPSLLSDLLKEEALFQGIQRDENLAVLPGPDGLIQHDSAGLRAASFTLYDAQRDLLKDVSQLRFTPKFA